MPPAEPELAAGAQEQRPSAPHARRVLWIVGASLLFVGAVIVALGLVLPARWLVERSILINAAPARIHAIASDLERWDDWAAWSRPAGKLPNQLGPVTKGAGASLRWRGSAEPDHGEVRIVQSDPDTGVQFEVDVADRPTSRASIRYRARPAATEVTWRDEGKLTPVIGGLLRDLVQTRLGEHMQGGLARLKALAEQPPSAATWNR